MILMKIALSLIAIMVFVVQTLAAPADLHQSLVVSSSEATIGQKLENEDYNLTESTPQIYEMHIRSNVRNRFSNTTIISKVKNLSQKSQEVTFSVILPEAAFISGFIMEVGGKNYTAYVKEKEEAKKDYDEAVSHGLGAAQVTVSARDSNRFTVSVNIEPETKSTFYLNYEELLKRKDEHYEHVINIHPGQPVKDLSVEVVIAETRKITDLKAPPLRSGNEIENQKSELDPRADLEIINDTTAIVKFRPTVEKQKQFAHLLGKKESEGIAGQFVVQYDVERDPQGGEVLIQDGYFVHFFAPSELVPIAKHVVFILDTSSSMNGSRIEQLKEAMHNILGQLHENDLFNLVEFNSDVKVWDIHDRNSSVLLRGNSDLVFNEYSFPSDYRATEDNIRKAKNTVSEFFAAQSTDIYFALRVGLHLKELANQKRVDNVVRQPIIVFLTDGYPTVGVRNQEEITNKISEFNVGSRQSAIFALSFGRGADSNFIKKLAIRNFGFAKRIYEAADAALQLQDFYRYISSPLLINVRFKYEPSVTSLTKKKFPIHFEGSELVVSGRYAGEHELKSSSVDALGARGWVSLKSRTIERSVSNIERLWAYLTIKELLEKNEVAVTDEEEIKKKALDLALQYSFVTPVSSLIVVKPNATTSVYANKASRDPDDDFYGTMSYGKSPSNQGNTRCSRDSHVSKRHALTTFGKTPSNRYSGNGCGGAASRRPDYGYGYDVTTFGEIPSNQDNTKYSEDDEVPRRHGGLTTFGKIPSNQDNTKYSEDGEFPRRHGGFTTFGKIPSNQDNTKDSEDGEVPRRHGGHGFPTFGKTPSNQGNTRCSRDSHVSKRHALTTFGKTPSNRYSGNGCGGAASRRPDYGYGYDVTTFGEIPSNQDNTKYSEDDEVPRRHGGLTTFGKIPSNQDNTKYSEDGEFPRRHGGFTTFEKIPANQDNTKDSEDGEVPRRHGGHGFTTFGKTPSNQDNTRYSEGSYASRRPDDGYGGTTLGEALEPNHNIHRESFENSSYVAPIKEPLFDSDVSTTTTRRYDTSIKSTQLPSSADLISVLPWLKNILNENGLLSLPSGNYKLGLNETITDNVACTNTPSNTTGHCFLLHSCPQVYSQLMNSEIFIRHSCIIRKEYAGICCPENQ